MLMKTFMTLNYFWVFNCSLGPGILLYLRNVCRGDGLGGRNEQAGCLSVAVAGKQLSTFTHHQ